MLINNLYWAALVCLGFAGILGLSGIWIPKFWESPYAIKMVLTFVVLAVIAIGSAGIMSFIK